MAGKRIETKASQTAGYTCFSRACAARERDPRLRGPDYLAERILPFGARLMAAIPPVRRLVMAKMFPAGIYEYVLARTKELDAAFLAALEARFDQIVLLGAGFDTRALRFAGRNRGTRIFELDVAPTLDPKVEILRRKRIPLPDELTFVRINFDKQELAAALAQAGFRRGRKDLFLMEGITMYLTASAVDRNFAFIRQHAAPGSRVVFDYIYASVLRRENRRYGEREIFETVSRAGEGWTFGLEDGEAESFLEQRGFRLIAHHTPAELQRKHLTAKNGTPLGRINGTHCIAVAEVR
ncbi:MAG: SAM-dependent methyltransferase [Anaerolineales bacterium]|nr:SAM-dependent methyltransferase [Anaerolineales bacterium]